LFVQNVQRYEPDKEGFIHVKQLDNIYFQTIDWDQLTSWACTKKLVLILPPKDLPEDKVKNVAMTEEEDLITANGATAFQVWSWDMSRVTEGTKHTLCNENTARLDLKK
jgi:hypothetical protein